MTKIKLNTTVQTVLVTRL